MAKREDPFVTHVVELLQAFGLVRPRAMFGGYGLYKEGVMFALIAEGVLYVKADDENRTRFEEAGQERFSYVKQGKRYFISYYTLPEAALEDPDVLLQWAETGYAAARRAKR